MNTEYRYILQAKWYVACFHYWNTTLVWYYDSFNQSMRLVRVSYKIRDERRDSDTRDKTPGETGQFLHGRR